MFPLVSVIIPVYGTEKYIKECLNSVICQRIMKYSNKESIEILIVNDETPDNSMSIVDSFKIKHDNIKIIEQSNAGQSVARNNAIKVSKGKYIYFLDSDDILPVDAIHELYKLALETRSEVIVSQSKAFNSRRSWYIEEHAEVASASFRKVKFFHHSILMKTPAPWAKLYSSDLIKRNNIKFPEGIKLAEDWIFVINAMHKANHISSSPLISYLYRGRDDEENPSCTQIVNEKVFSDLIKVYKLTLKFNLPERQTFLAKLFILRGILYRLFKYSQDNSFEDTKQIYKVLHSFLVQYIGYRAIEVFTPERRLPLMMLYYKYYSEAHRVLNNQITKGIIKKSNKHTDKNIHFDYKTIKLKQRRKKINKIKIYDKEKRENNNFILKYKLAKSILKLKKPIDENIVLIGERAGKTANDSSYHLFRYLNSKKHNSNYKYYYVIDKSSKTYNNIKHLP